MSYEDKTSAALGCILTLTAIPVSAIASGMVLVKMWEWFVIPIFHLPPLTVGYALGIASIVSYMTYQSIDCSEPDRTPIENAVRSWVSALMRPLVTLLFGWLILKAQGR